MGKVVLHLLGMTFLCLLSPGGLQANPDLFEERARVAMRVIGHELLLSTGDHTSRVLPIEKEAGRFKIQLNTTFSFDPDSLTRIVDSVMTQSNLASGYLVEIEDCDSDTVVYSYRMDLKDPDFFAPCKGRIQPEGCYTVWVRLLAVNPLDAWDPDAAEAIAIPIDESHMTSGGTGIIYYLIIGLVMGILIVLGLRSRSAKKGGHLIKIGSYLFDPVNMILMKGNEKQDLTGKETHLLQLLYNHLNSTVDRDVILKEVWSDDGAYVGRTLDVYISKLRKKLESEPAVSIINVRGVGYKLTMD